MKHSVMLCLQDQIIASSAANNEVKNVSLVNPLEYAIKLTMENRGTSSAKVQQRYLFPDGVEVKAFNLQDDGHRASECLTFHRASHHLFAKLYSMNSMHMISRNNSANANAECNIVVMMMYDIPTDHTNSFIRPFLTTERNNVPQLLLRNRSGNECPCRNGYILSHAHTPAFPAQCTVLDWHQSM